MRIAVTTEDGKSISEHFGRTPFFAIYDVQDNQPVLTEMRRNTFTHHMRQGMGFHEEPHKPGQSGRSHDTIAKALSDCNVVISHGMGRRAWEDLRAAGIEMIVTDERLVDVAVKKYLSGNLPDRVEKLH